MEKTFQAYYRPSEKTFKALWLKCLFVPDTNVLLNIYRYSENTRRELMGIFEKISPQLWIPHQVGLEYQKLRPGVILQQEKAYDEIKKILEDVEIGLDKKLTLSQPHPLIDRGGVLKRIKEFLVTVESELDKQKSKHPDLLEHDTLRDEITKLFEGKVGQGFPSEKLEELYRQGDKRYKKRIPPGYMDEKKDGDEKYGDLVIWFQMIEKAKESSKPIIFITDDIKEDWWFWAKEKRIGPRPELIEEMLKEAGKEFYVYGIERFMEYSKAFLNRKVDQKAIKEVRDLKEQSHTFAESLSEIGKSLAEAKYSAIRREALKSVFLPLPSSTQAMINAIAPSTASAQAMIDALMPSAASTQAVLDALAIRAASAHAIADKLEVLKDEISKKSSAKDKVKERG